MSDSTLTRRDSLRNLAALGLAGVAVAAGAAVVATPAEAAQPLMADALKGLQDARAVLAAAAHDKGGHRVKAIALIDQAIAQVKLGMVVGAM